MILRPGADMIWVKSSINLTKVNVRGKQWDPYIILKDQTRILVVTKILAWGTQWITTWTMSCCGIVKNSRRCSGFPVSFRFPARWSIDSLIPVSVAAMGFQSQLGLWKMPENSDQVHLVFLGFMGKLQCVIYIYIHLSVYIQLHASLYMEGFILAT